METPNTPEEAKAMLGHESARQGVSSATAVQSSPEMLPTDTTNPDYFHKVVDCQWACPAHTPVPEYIRLIAAGRYADAYMVNWASNVFPGILGRTCDRPCEPACRRGRVEAEPVAICRLKRVAADNKGDIRSALPKAPATRNGKRVALVGAGPASLTVARDLAPLGYEITLFDGAVCGGGMIRSQIPRFRLPESVIDEEVDYITSIGGIETCYGQRIESLHELLHGGYDVVFIGTGAPRGRDLDIPGRCEAASNIHIGIDWLANVSFGHVERIGSRVVVLGGGNTAMDCCRTARRLGGEEVTVVVRSGFTRDESLALGERGCQARGHPYPRFPRARLSPTRRAGSRACCSRRSRLSATRKDGGSLCPPASRMS